MAESPLCSGMAMSSRRTEGFVSRARSTASAPFAASPTTSMSFWPAISSRRPVLNTAWSSAITTRVFMARPL